MNTKYLIYVNMQGESVLLNQKEVLDALTLHKDENRSVQEQVDDGNEEAIQELVKALKLWLKKQAAGEATDVLSKLSKGDKNAFKRIKENKTGKEKFQLTNFDLITWFLVSV